MPTYLNANLIITSLTYASVQPAQNAVYKDTGGISYTIIAVQGAGASAQYAVTTLGYNNLDPKLGTLTKVSGTGDATVTLKAYVQNAVSIIGFTRIEPGQTVATGEYLLNLPWDVVQTSASPYMDTMIYSAKLTGTTTVNIPTTVVDSSSGLTIPLLTNYKFRAYVGLGECSIQLNNVAAVSRYVGLYDTYEIFCSTRMVNSVILTISSGTVYVSIEKL